MRIGIFILPDTPWAVARERWRRAEEYGFDHAWTYDHLGWRDLVDGPWFDAVPTLTAAALVTSRIRLGTMVASPNFRHPVRFARAVTALDDVSGGRISLGLGSGGTGFDAAVLGAPPLSPREQVDRFEEFLTLLDLLLTSGRVTWHGKYYHAVDARSAVARMPFIVAGNGPRSIGLAARFGQAWVTTGTPASSLDDWWRGVASLKRRFEDTGSTVDTFLSLDAAPVFSLSSAAYFADAVGRAADLGFTDVLTHWPRSSSWYAGSEDTLEEVASTLRR